MKLEFLMEYNADLQAPTRDTGAGPFGTRGLAILTGGSFEGPRLKGTLWAGGGDWVLRGSDGVRRLDVRCQPPFKSRPESFLESDECLRRSVRGQNHLSLLPM